MYDYWSVGKSIAITNNRMDAIQAQNYPKFIICANNNTDATFSDSDKDLF